MKNISLALNVVLLVAVGVLYYLHFAKGESRTSNMPSTAQQLGVAYINSDTVLKYYDYFKVNRDRLETKGKKLDQDLKTRVRIEPPIGIPTMVMASCQHIDLSQLSSHRVAKE